MKYLKLSLISILLIPVLVSAHGPSRQKVVQEIMKNQCTTEKIVVLQYCLIYSTRRKKN